MQPTSNVDNLENVDLTTESLPAVDTPDACDKAALRYQTFSSHFFFWLIKRILMLKYK